MTLELEQHINLDEAVLKNQSTLTGFVENYLFSLWSKQVGEDQLRPLFTRIANQVIFVK